MLGKVAPFPGLPSAQVADRMDSAGVVMAVGDMVTLGEDVGVIVACAVDSAELFAVVQPLQKKAGLARFVSQYSMTGGMEIWPALSCALALAWRDRPDGSVVVVRR